MHDLEGVLGPTVISFVENHVSSLLTWDVLVYFYRNPDAVVDVESLANRLGRRPDEIAPEITQMCEGQILQCSNGLIRYKPTIQMAEQVGEFVDACQDRGRRLALIALVLHRIGRAPGDA